MENDGEQGEINFLMEKLLDEQDANAKLKQEIKVLAARLAAAEVTGHGVSTPSALRATTLDELHQRRSRFLQELALVEDELQVRALELCNTYSASSSNDVASTHTLRQSELARREAERTAVVIAAMGQLKAEVVDLSGAAKAEELLRAVGRASRDPSTFQNALKTMKTLIPCGLQAIPSPVDDSRVGVALESFCRKEIAGGAQGRLSLLKAMLDLVVGFELHWQTLMAVQRESVEEVVKLHRALIRVARCCSGRQVDALSLDEYKVAPIRMPTTLQKDAAHVIIGQPVAVRTASRSPMRPTISTPRTRSISPRYGSSSTSSAAARTAAVSPNTVERKKRVTAAGGGVGFTTTPRGRSAATAADASAAGNSATKPPLSGATPPPSTRQPNLETEVTPPPSRPRPTAPTSAPTAVARDRPSPAPTVGTIQVASKQPAAVAFVQPAIQAVPVARIGGHSSAAMARRIAHQQDSQQPTPLPRLGRAEPRATKSIRSIIEGEITTAEQQHQDPEARCAQLQPTPQPTIATEQKKPRVATPHRSFDPRIEMEEEDCEEDDDDDAWNRFVDQQKQKQQQQQHMLKEREEEEGELAPIVHPPKYSNPQEAPAPPEVSAMKGARPTTPEPQKRVLFQDSAPAVPPRL